MTRVWIYIVSASNDPDNIRCVVPWRVDDDLIFFGPCKKRIREQLRRDYLEKNRPHSLVSDPVYIVGVNGGNLERVRKIIWWGQVCEVMTFAEAYKRLQGKLFYKLRSHRMSPLHVRPLVEDGKFVGYEHISEEHIKDQAWVSDLVSKKSERKVSREGRKLLLISGDYWETFDRDCCMLLKNHFFAKGKGIEFDEHGMDLLRKAQPGKLGINPYAVFGVAVNGSINGLRGHSLKLHPKTHYDLPDLFVSWLKYRSLNI